QNLKKSKKISEMILDRALHIKRFTPRVQDLFNIIPSDLGRPFSHLTHKLEADDLPALAQGVLQTLRTVEREVRTREGRRYLTRFLPYRSLEDRIGGVVLTFVEVSDLRDAVDARRHYQAALETSEQRLKAALLAAPILIVSHDAKLQTTWGYLLGNEIGPSPDALTAHFAPGHADKFAAIARRVLDSSHGERVELDLMIDRKPHTYDLRIHRDELGVTTVGFDITPSKLAETSLLESDRHKDEFLATLSHELRNPLTPLKVALDIAKLADRDPSKLGHALGIMERQIEQMAQLVDDLLDLSRITQGKIEIERVPLDPATIVEAALEATRPLLQQRQHHITVDVPMTSRRVLGDHLRLTQVLTNLLNNAAKYTPERGHIHLSVGADAARDQLVLRIRDDGPGIAPEMLQQIFGIFVQSRDTTGRASNGLGIGLHLVQRIVELHGGRVRASSDGPGAGSEFTVELPLAPDTNRNSAAA
ncbi:MAG: ATP-binding protein, partial [bacterium]